MDEPIEMIPLLCRIAVGLIVFIGATMGVYSMLSRQFLRQSLRLPAAEFVRNRPLSQLSAIPVILVTILFSLMAAVQTKQSPATPPPASALLLGAGLYSFALLIAVFGCLSYSRTGFRAAFGMDACPWPVAAKKGIRYGLEILPLVLLVSIVVSCIGESLGFDMKAQQIFDCLNDPSASVGGPRGLNVLRCRCCPHPGGAFVPRRPFFSCFKGANLSFWSAPDKSLFRAHAFTRALLVITVGVKCRFFSWLCSDRLNPDANRHACPF
jgi:hypothetical protein